MIGVRNNLNKRKQVVRSEKKVLKRFEKVSFKNICSINNITDIFGHGKRFANLFP